MLSCRQDFIRLSLVPPNPKTSPLLEHENLFSIRLVTDSYAEAREEVHFPFAW